MKKLILILAAVAISHSIGYTQGCLPEGITIGIQAQIDNFQTNYPGCTEIEGDVTITGSTITNLNGLNVLTSIGGNLQIGDIWYGGNPALTSLSGLESLTSIGGYFGIDDDDALTSLNGLDNLTSIGGWFSISNSYALTSLSGLESLTSIGGDLYINSNNALASLSGLDNLEAASITDLYIRGNTSLSTCEVQSICDYLVVFNGTTSIYNNAPGCNSPGEVEEACEIVGIEDQLAGSPFLIFPNPANNLLTIQLSLEKPETLRITLLNVSGQQMAVVADEQTKAGEYRAEIDISSYPSGVYFSRLKVGNEVVSRKIVKY